MADLTPQRGSHAERLVLSVATPGSECIVFDGYIDRTGYGTLRCGGRTWGAHRLVYWLTVGPIPEGLVIDHLCRNRACVNPRHLEAVTQRENIMRGIGEAKVNAEKTHCVNGHEFTLEGVYEFRGSIHRRCLICNKAYSERSYKRRRGHA